MSSSAIPHAPAPLPGDAAGFPIMEEPAHGWSRDGKSPYRPTVREVLADAIDGIDLRRGRTRVVPFLWFVFYLGTFAATLAYLGRGPRPATLAALAAAVSFLSIVYNTLWMHRYCSHRAFRFARPWVRQVFLWTNPIFFREESYALPHHVHHALSDGPGDPYGPHLGRLGSAVSFETEQRTRRAIPEWRYRALVKLVAHIGFPVNSYEDFRRTQSVERVSHFLTRATVAQGLWAAAAFAAGGVEGVLTWYTAVFGFLTLLRDFNWQGHGARRAAEEAPNRPGPSLARNQAFYGLIAGEWHGNHHLKPRSARAGGPGQPDAAFAVIRLLHRLGLVASYREELVTPAPGPLAEGGRA
jgi:stearoyl-CoA desaturase (delta-9 desaturase)